MQQLVFQRQHSDEGEVVGVWHAGAGYGGHHREQIVLSLKTGGPKTASSSFSSGLAAAGASSSDSRRLWQVMLSVSLPETGWQLLAGPDSPLDSHNP